MTRSGRTFMLSKFYDFMLFLEEPPEFEAWEHMTYGGVNGINAVCYYTGWGQFEKDLRFGTGQARYADGRPYLQMLRVLAVSHE